mgnify:CR=1 FL=1
MSDSVSIKVPKWIMPVITAVVASLVLAVVAWAWNAESSISKGEEALSKINEISDQMVIADKEQALLRQELKYIRKDIAEIAELIKTQK